MSKKSTADKVKGLFQAYEESETPAKEVKKVAKVKKVTKAEAEEKETKASKKSAKANGKTETKGKPEKESKGARGAQEVPEGHVSVAMLAEEAEITPQSARVKLRGSDIDRPEGRWVWPEGSKGLKKAREILGL